MVPSLLWHLAMSLMYTEQGEGVKPSFVGDNL